ncbi:MAG: phosphate signaling complex protein PhoU [Candidatus Pseudoruminococcus sp.]|uniref:phosphate signaling complex protein PhoU n=1 Tax=Candidatus Pseudoruminococcus sp. TaxID=3101048 RepID=UPI002A7C707F|nr:phosphate signaling complex protein PhoU [Ruminococcus sp.]MDY2783673.1 phosphate signaling complex protein PhoU [Candidatus Pseudoruminococcus sp.]
MRNSFDMQLRKLNNELIEMGSLIETAIARAYNALINQNIEVARENVEFDREIDQKEKEVENICLKLLLQQQPVASDLRLISSAIKMITDMERIGDQAADISELTILMAKTQYIKRLDHIEQMAKATIEMVTTSVDAFVKRDLELARSVFARDDIVDNLFVTIKNDLIELIREDVNNGEQAIDLIMVAKYFERIGDHAVNLADWVIFSILGHHEEYDGN